MSSKTKIVVLRMKELIYTGIFVLLGILLLILLITMFSPEKNADLPVHKEEADLYQPGIYTASILLGGNAIDLSVILERGSITSIQLVNLNETMATMYPLMEPALENLTQQIVSSQSLENIAYPEENQYTSMVILDAIRMAVEKGRLPDTEAGTEPAPNTGGEPAADTGL